MVAKSSLGSRERQVEIGPGLGTSGEPAVLITCLQCNSLERLLGDRIQNVNWVLN